MKEEFTEPSIWSGARRPRPGLVQPDNDAEGTDIAEEAATSISEEVLGDPDSLGHRSVFQQDYDRLLFSTPVRRLADKTQVWPMDDNDGVRTRLTHSHEVANLARSIGTRAHNYSNEYFRDHCGEVSLGEVIQPMLMAIGLGHDLGNPPFGHQGEAAIGRWFERRRAWLFTHTKEGGAELSHPVPEDLWPEFTEFDGNPQSLRLLTKLQTHIDYLGLDLSAATLAAGMKYPVHISNRNKKRALAKKGGYFESERSVVSWIREKTGLAEGQRHPLTWIMEACDDIAYSVLDVDDLLKKGMMSPDDVLVILRRNISCHPIVEKLSVRFHDVESRDLVPEMQHDIKVQYLRAFLIETLINEASKSFIDNTTPIFHHDHEAALMEGSTLCDLLKEVAQQNAFSHPTVLHTEALGAAAVAELMTAFWDAITDRKNEGDLRSRRNGARAKYIFSLISPNYIEAATSFENLSNPASIQRYRELRLLTDMVSGMTDTFAIKLWNNIKAIPHADRA